jgi:hypothetical protein
VNVSAPANSTSRSAGSRSPSRPCQRRRTGGPGCLAGHREWAPALLQGRFAQRLRRSLQRGRVGPTRGRANARRGPLRWRDGLALARVDRRDLPARQVRHLTAHQERVRGEGADPERNHCKICNGSMRGLARGYS